ncbi:toast rack family protein [Metasolibacillus meyeri]|uniref:toast rack family protein n=1 Tax=Metasolibacillus meyeri TaxID=1071052 RepID=UPI000D3190E9|nr:toast rack family protein [Metasolibacillus meyeri]
MKKMIILGAVVGASVMMLAGCFSFIPGKTKEESIEVEKDKATNLNVDIDLGLGEVTVEKGAQQWVEGTAQYNNKKLAPQVSYKLKGQTGKVEIEQKGGKGIGLSEVKSNWKLMLNEDVPMNLDVKTGAAVANLDLQGLQLESLDIDTGIGDLTVNLGGDWAKSFDTTIESGVGKTTVILPSTVGVKITVEKGIGTVDIAGFIAQEKGVYVNEAYGQEDVTININVEMGIGDVTFKLDK